MKKLMHRPAALLASLSSKVPAEVRTVLGVAAVSAAVLTSMSSLNLFSTRVTKAPPVAPVPSPWTLGHAKAIDDSACQLAIRVRDDAGDVLADAPLHVVRIVDGGEVVERYSARTDARGGHRLIDLPQGHYDITVDVPGKALAGAPTFTCDHDGRRAFFDVDVKDAGHVVEGTMLGRNKRPLSSATLALWQDDNARSGLAGVVRLRTDADGRFSARASWRCRSGRSGQSGCAGDPSSRS